MARFAFRMPAKFTLGALFVALFRQFQRLTCAKFALSAYSEVRDWKLLLWTAVLSILLRGSFVTFFMPTTFVPVTPTTFVSVFEVAPSGMVVSSRIAPCRLMPIRFVPSKQVRQVSLA